MAVQPALWKKETSFNNTLSSESANSRSLLHISLLHTMLLIFTIMLLFCFPFIFHECTCPTRVMINTWNLESTEYFSYRIKPILFMIHTRRYFTIQWLILLQSRSEHSTVHTSSHGSKYNCVFVFFLWQTLAVWLCSVRREQTQRFTR